MFEGIAPNSLARENAVRSNESAIHFTQGCSEIRISLWLTKPIPEPVKIMSSFRI